MAGMASSIRGAAGHVQPGKPKGLISRSIISILQCSTWEHAFVQQGNIGGSSGILWRSGAGAYVVGVAEEFGGHSVMGMART